MQTTKPIPKGPKGHLLFGSTEEFKRDSISFLTNCRDEYGNVVPFRIGPFPVLFVNEPELIHEILVNQAQNFSKDAALKNNREFFGHGLLSSEGEYWKRQRKLSSPAFSPKRLETYSQIMTDYTHKMLDEWQDGQVLDIQKEMMGLTFGIATKTLFDVEIEEEKEILEKSLNSAWKYLADRMNDTWILLLPEWIPFPTNIHLLAEVKKIDKIVYKLIKERRATAEGRIDLLSTFLCVKDEETGTGMTDKQIRDEVFTLFFAGHETTALTLTWTLALLAEHPQIEQQLFTEIKEVLNGRQPNISDYSRLAFTEKVVKESMRLRPPVWAIGRECINNCQIGDYQVHKGTAVIISEWTMHTDKRYYKNPESFDPNRWTSEFTNNLPKFAYFPFGGGPRTCIGNGFAMIESVLALASIVQNFQLTLASPTKIDVMPAVTLRPKQKIQMLAKRR